MQKLLIERIKKTRFSAGKINQQFRPFSLICSFIPNMFSSLEIRNYGPACFISPSDLVASNFLKKNRKENIKYDLKRMSHLHINTTQDMISVGIVSHFEMYCASLYNVF